MFRKSYVSIYFLSEELQVVQLDSAKKRVKKFASVSLPSGVVDGQRVADISSLANIIKATWKKLQIREKSVFLIIPEFSTFVKLFEIEGVELSDLDEAIEWQIHEYMPTETQDLVIDWKIVGKSGKTYQILVVALEKSTLEGFVKSAEEAGLLPQVVEIPSLSLNRIVKADGLNLVVYQGKGESILGVFEKEKLLASSVVEGKDEKELETTLRRMLMYFKERGLSKILVSGVSIDNTFFESLSKNFGVALEVLPPPLEDLKEEEIQNYLIPISSCLQEPAEPSDPFSLNLLPASLVEKYRRMKLRLQIWSLILTVTLFISTSFLLALGGYFFFNQQIQGVKVQGGESFEAIKRMQEADAKVRGVNVVSDRVAKIADASVPPQVVLNEITKARVPGISISEYSLDLDKGLIKISGVASNRNALLAFKQNLQGNSNIGQIDIPISSFEKDVNLDFEASFLYLPLVGKEGGVTPKP